MKSILFIFIASLILFSCGGEKKSSPQSPQVKTIAALYMKNSGLDFGVFKRVIKDSAGKSDTIYGMQQQRTRFDKDGQPVKDSTGQIWTETFYIPISKDSLWWDLSNKDLDSLINTINKK